MEENTLKLLFHNWGTESQRRKTAAELTQRFIEGRALDWQAFGPAHTQAHIHTHTFTPLNGAVISYILCCAWLVA